MSKPMKLVLLTRFHSQHQGAPLVQRLTAAALTLGHELSLVNPADVILDFNTPQGRGIMPAKWHGQPFPQADLVLPIARWDDAHCWQIAETLEAWGAPVTMHQRVPLGDNITMARLLARRNIPAPRSWVLGHADQLAVVLPELTFPVLMRSRYGGAGRRVVVVQHSGEAYSHAEYLTAGGQPFLLQDLPLPVGEDVRVLVVGTQVFAAVLRQAPAGFVRPKEDGNPTVTPTPLTDEELRVVLAGAQLYGAPFCAVNLLRTKQGPQLLDISRVPTLAELETATGVDLATPIVQHLGTLAVQKAKDAEKRVVVMQKLPTATGG
jgi:ribosomal protein S6--L-glutamate ligase